MDTIKLVMLQTLYSLALRSERRVALSILFCDSLLKLSELGKLLQAIHSEQQGVRVLKDAVHLINERMESGSCEFCPADGGGCSVCLFG